MQSLSKIFANLINVPAPNPEDARRRRLLNIFLAVLFVCDISVLLGCLIYAPPSLAAKNMDVFRLYIAISVSLIAIIPFYLINRFLSGEIAGTILLITFIFLSAYTDQPIEVVNGRSLILFAFPILAASVLLRPWASLVMAVGSSLAIVLVGRQMPDQLINLSAVALFLVLGIVTWITVQSHLKTLKQLESSNTSLRENEDKLQSIFRAAPIGIGLVSNRIIKGVNEHLCAMLGYNAEELLEQSALIIYPNQAEFDRVGREKYAQIAEHGVGTVETVWRCKDGTNIDILLSSAPIDPADQSKGLTFTALDITDRKRAQDQLAVTEENYRTLVEQVPAVIYIDAVDDDSKSLYMSPQVEALSGYTSDEWVNTSDLWLRVIHPDDRERVESENLRTNRNGEPFKIEYRMVRRDGKVVWVNDQATLVRDETGSPLFWRGILTDITERKYTSETLRTNEEKYRVVTENIPVVVYSALPDEYSTNIFMSGKAQGLTGYTVEEFMGNPSLWTKILHPDDTERVWQTISLHRETKSELDVEYRIYTKDNQLRWIRDVATPLLDQDGKIVQINGFMEDITERKRQEIEMEAIMMVSAALRRATSRKEMMPVILEQIFTLIDAKTSQIGLVDENNHCIRIDHAKGLWGKRAGHSISLDEPIVKDVYSSRQPYITHDLKKDGYDYFKDLTPEYKGAACLPLISHETVIGLIGVGLTREIRDEDIRLLTAVADIAANAVHRTSLHEQTEMRLKRINALRAIDRAINSSLDLRLTLDILLNQVLYELGIDAATVMLFNRKSQILETLASRGFRNTRNLAQNFRLGNDLTSQAVLERRTIHSANVSLKEAVVLAPARFTGEGFVAYYAVPLVSKGVVKGVLELWKRSPHKPDPEWSSFLESLAEQAAIALDNAELFRDLQRSHNELAVAYDATIEGWSRALDLRDRETEGHTQRVTELTKRLALALGIAEDDLVHIQRGALLHDIGKMGIPDSILNKPGPLTDQEWEIMRKHPIYAYDLLSTITYLRPAIDIPYGHHEKWDGTGYPRKLAGEKIPLTARIFSVVDVWDALRSNRPYRSAWPDEKVHEYIRSQSGSHFEPKVVEAFFRLIESA
jgi:PAS domain S-box-containing protein